MCILRRERESLFASISVTVVVVQYSGLSSCTRCSIESQLLVTDSGQWPRTPQRTASVAPHDNAPAQPPGAAAWVWGAGVATAASSTASRRTPAPASSTSAAPASRVAPPHGQGQTHCSLQICIQLLKAPYILYVRYIVEACLRPLSHCKKTVERGVRRPSIMLYLQYHIHL